MGQESFREIIHQFGETWEMEECIKKYGGGMKNEIDEAFRIFDIRYP